MKPRRLTRCFVTIASASAKPSKWLRVRRDGKGRLEPMYLVEFPGPAHGFTDYGEVTRGAR